MIYYFSGTGNSEWVARQIAEKTADTAMSITDVVKNNQPLQPIGENDLLGIVFPVYAWSTPKYVTRFVKRLKVHQKAFVYAVATCEAEVGSAFLWLRPHLRMDSKYTVIMPNNYVVWGYSTNSHGQNLRIIENAKPTIDYIAESVNTRYRETKRPAEALRLFKSYIIAPIFRATRSDRQFYVDDKCTGCGLCEKLCPVSDIRLSDGKPLWMHKGCMHCTACINHCPAQAIQYGASTKSSGRYVFPGQKIKD